MDFVHLVESGQYDPKELEPERWQFCNGIKTAIEDVDAAIALDYQDFDDTPLHERFVNSVAQEVAEHVKRYLYSTYCESVVSLLDDQSVQEDAE